MAHKYIYDLPVYRIPEETYYAQRAAYIDKTIFPAHAPNTAELRRIEATSPGINNALRSHLEKSYGGAWNYNEIIGYIRLHILGTQIRGEYFAVNKKRILRTRNRQLEFKTWKLAPEVEIQDPFNDTNILAAIYQYIDDCRRELPSRFIDSEVFDGLSEFVNWERLFNENDA